MQALNVRYTYALHQSLPGSSNDLASNMNVSKDVRAREGHGTSDRLSTGHCSKLSSSAGPAVQRSAACCNVLSQMHHCAVQSRILDVTGCYTTWYACTLYQSSSS